MNQTKVLIIEDDKAILNFIRVSLKAHDYACTEAETGKSGLKLFTTIQPDVVLLDLGLPDMDGTEVLKEIRSFSDLVGVLEEDGRVTEPLHEEEGARTEHERDDDGEAQLHRVRRSSERARRSSHTAYAARDARVMP
jgi:CheY-like chemotaxis protein